MVVLLIDEHRVPFDGSLEYGFSNIHDCLSLNPEALDLLKADCQEAFSCRSIQGADESYSSGSTYFVTADQTPRCLLEQLALSIFRFHTKDAVFDPATSGAEWWTQVLDCRDDVGFHWDRDYGTEEDTGQNIHPHLATVTYLTDLGGPTVVLSKIGTIHTDDSLLGTVDEIIVSRPMFGKHIKFDGRLLHAAPCDFLELKTEEDEEESDEEGGESEGDENEGEGEEGGESSDDDDEQYSEEEEEGEEGEEEGSESDENASSSKSKPAATSSSASAARDMNKDTNNNSNKGQNKNMTEDMNNKRDGNSSESDESVDDDDDDDSYPKRITFLVNIWLNHIPIQSAAFPSSRVKSLQPPLSATSTCKLFQLPGNAVDVEECSSSSGDVSSKECSSVTVPSIEIESLLDADIVEEKRNIKGSNGSSSGSCSSNGSSSEKKIEKKGEGEGESGYQIRKWWFTHGSVKYQVTIPLPPFNRLQCVNIDYDAFRLLYSSSGVSIEIAPAVSNKRKATSICDSFSNSTAASVDGSILIPADDVTHPVDNAMCRKKAKKS